MVDSILVNDNLSVGKKIAYKTIISAGIIALAVILPQIVHLVLGQPGGVKWLPMYLPVLLGGCLLGPGYGAAVGFFSPVISHFITSAMGSPMPPAARLPFMTVELVLFGLISGVFSKKITKTPLWAFPAVILAQITGRAVFLGIVALARDLAPFTTEMVWEQIKTGFIGLALQAILVPVIVIVLHKALVKENE